MALSMHLGMEGPLLRKTLKRLHFHAVNSLASIIRMRRRLEGMRMRPQRKQFTEIENGNGLQTSINHRRVQWWTEWRPVGHTLCLP